MKEGKDLESESLCFRLDFVATFLQLSVPAKFTAFKQIVEERLLIPPLLDRMGQMREKLSGKKF